MNPHFSSVIKLEVSNPGDTPDQQFQCYHTKLTFELRGPFIFELWPQMPHEWRYNIRPSFLHHLDLCSKAFHRTMVHGTSTFDLRIEFKNFFPVILYIGLHPQHTFYGLYYLQFSLLIIIFTASQVFDRFWGHVPAGVAFSANIYLLGLPIKVFICYLQGYKTCLNM